MSASIIIRGNIRLINARPIDAPTAGGNVINIASNMISSYEYRRASVLPQMIVMFVMAVVFGLPYVIWIRPNYPAEFAIMMTMIVIWAICLCGGVVRHCMTRIEHPIRVDTLEDGCIVRANVPCIINIVDLGQQYFLTPS